MKRTGNDRGRERGMIGEGNGERAGNDLGMIGE